MTTQEIVKRFCDRCREAKVAYNEYIFLYESGKEVRLELLNNIARDFFCDLQDILIEYSILNICKLTGFPGRGKKKNLTVKYILEQVEPQVQHELGLEELSKKLHQFGKHLVDARNKLIAHQDVDTLSSENNLGAFPEGADKQFWADLQEFVNRIHGHYLDGIFPLDAANIYNSEDLILALKKAAYFDQHFKNELHSRLLEENQFRYRDA